MKNGIPLVVLMSAFTYMQAGNALANHVCSGLSSDEQEFNNEQQAYKNEESDQTKAATDYSASIKVAQAAKTKDDKAKGLVKKDASTVNADQNLLTRAQSNETKAEQVDSKAKDAITAAKTAVTKAQGNYNDTANAIAQFVSDSSRPPLSCNVTFPASAGMTKNCVAAIGTYNSMEAKLPSLQKSIDAAKANVIAATTTEATTAGLISKAKDAISAAQQTLDGAKQILAEDTSAEGKTAGDLASALAAKAAKLADYNKAKDDTTAARQSMIAANTKVVACKQNK